MPTQPIGADTVTGALPNPVDLFVKGRIRDTQANGVRRLTKTGNKLSTRVVGCNIYDLLLSDNYSTGVRRLTYGEMTRRLDAAKAMGHNLVRTHAMISFGQVDSLMPTIGNYNEAAFVALDAIIDEARKRGLWLMCPLTDMYQYYHGGAITFAKMSEGTTANTDSYYQNYFFTNATCIQQFKNYITYVLSRVSTITGLAPKDDPTIAILENGNEIYAATQAWSTGIFSTLRSLAPNTLLADGTNATQSRHPNGQSTMGFSSDGYNSLLLDCDIVGGHWYDDRDGGYLDRGAAMAAAANKVYLVGEWGWTDTKNGNSTVAMGGLKRADFLARIENNANIAGDLFWSIITDPTNNVHDDGYQLFYPPLNDEQRRGMDDLSRHAGNMLERTGTLALPVPTVLTAFGDTFDTAGAVSSAKWVNGSYGAGATASVVTAGTLSLTSGTAGSYSGDASLASRAPARKNRRISLDVTPANIANEQYFRLILRGQGDGRSSVDGILNEYYVEVNNSGNYNVSKHVAGANTVMGPSSNATTIPNWAAGVTQTMEFEIIDTTINFRVWRPGTDTRPDVPTFSYTDTTPVLQMPGYCGLALSNGSSTTSVTWTADNWVISDFPEPQDTVPVQSATVESYFFQVPVAGGNLAVATGLLQLPISGGAFKILSIAARAGTAPTGSSAILDVKKNGSTIFTTAANRPTFAAGSQAAVVGVPDMVDLVTGDWLSVDVAQVGSTVAGANVSLVVRLQRVS